MAITLADLEAHRDDLFTALRAAPLMPEHTGEHHVKYIEYRRSLMDELSAVQEQIANIVGPVESHIYGDV